MSKMRSSISRAQSYRQMGEFWDTHDLTDYWDKTYPVEFVIDIQSEVTYYPVDSTLSADSSQLPPTGRKGEVLVAIVPDLLDFTILRDQHWYRIPVQSAEKWIGKAWPPEWLAPYLPMKFGSAACKVTYVTRVLDIRQVLRRQLFPDQPAEEKSSHLYYQIMVEPLQMLPYPIPSRRQRRITFIPTTWQRLLGAHEINDLYHGSPIEESLWEEFARRRITAERQEEIQTKAGFYFLDFAIHCADANIDVETDGDAWHANPERAGKDNLRDNELEVAGWHLLRFKSQAIKEQMAQYCIPKIVKEINNCGGLDEGRAEPRKIDPAAPPGSYQPSLFGEQ